jgi:glycosyltransferase involved in cell wall biosynthesis
MSFKTVIQIIDSLYRGGAQKVVLDVVKALPEYKHLVCYWDKNTALKSEFESLNVELIRIPFRGVFYLPHTIYFMQRLLSQIQVDYIHTHMFVPNIIAYSVKGKHIKTIRTYHGECFERKDWRGWLIKKADAITLKSTDHIIAVSHHVKEYLHAELETNLPIEVIHNYGATPINARRQKDETSGLRLIATSNNQSYKNYPLLIKALSMLQHASITVDIYGGDMAPLIQHCTLFNIHNVNFRGVVTNISEILFEYDAYIATSSHGEGFSLSMLEAMNAGLPIICSDIPQFVEAVGDGGIVFKNRDVDSLIKTLESVIKKPNILKQKSEEIRKRAGLFSKELFERRIRKVYGLDILN